MRVYRKNKEENTSTNGKVSPDIETDGINKDLKEEVRYEI